MNIKSKRISFVYRKPVIIVRIVCKLYDRFDSGYFDLVNRERYNRTTVIDGGQINILFKNHTLHLIYKSRPI